MIISLQEALLRDDTGGAEIKVGSFVAIHKDRWLIECAAATRDAAKADLDQFCEEMEMPSIAFEIAQVGE